MLECTGGMGLQSSPGRTLVWNATCIGTVALSHLARAAREAGAAAAAMAEKVKKALYIDLAWMHHFVAGAVETAGAMDRAMPWISLLTLAAKSEQCPMKHNCVVILQQVSVAIQQGNAVSVLRTFG